MQEPRKLADFYTENAQVFIDVTNSQDLPLFFAQNLLSPHRVVKQFTNDVQAHIRVFYYQYLKLCFAGAVENSQNYINHIENILNDPNFKFLFFITDDPEIFNDFQFKCLVSQFFQYLNEHQITVDEALNSFPIMDVVFVYFFRTVLIVMQVCANLESQIEQSFLIKKLAQTFGVSISFHDCCIKYDETDVFVYQDQPNIIFMTYMDGREEVTDYNEEYSREQHQTNRLEAERDYDSSAEKNNHFESDARNQHYVHQQELKQYSNSLYQDNIPNGEYNSIQRNDVYQKQRKQIFQELHERQSVIETQKKRKQQLHHELQNKNNTFKGQTMVSNQINRQSQSQSQGEKSKNDKIKEEQLEREQKARRKAQADKREEERKRIEEQRNRIAREQTNNRQAEGKKRMNDAAVSQGRTGVVRVNQSYIESQFVDFTDTKRVQNLQQLGKNTTLQSHAYPAQSVPYLQSDRESESMQGSKYQQYKNSIQKDSYVTTAVSNNLYSYNTSSAQVQSSNYNSSKSSDFNISRLLKSLNVEKDFSNENVRRALCEPFRSNVESIIARMSKLTANFNRITV